MTQLRVVKLGGSLFDLPDLPARLANWLAAEPPARNVIVCGGGELAEEIRRLDARWSLGETASHWLCVELLNVTARLVATACRWPWTDSRESLGTAAETVVFAPAKFLRDDEPHLPGVRLPASWDVTSDSIAARLAVVLDADELVLLKSTIRDRDAGLVDRFFPQVAARVRRVRFVNLRECTR